MFTTKNQLIDYLVLLLLLLLGFWQIVTGVGIMKWDIMDIYLPWKYFVGESIRNGHLPLWNPFLNSGFPQMGDPNTWYPVSWIIVLFRRYDVYSVHFEHLLHLYIAGIGMYKVAQQYKLSRTTSVLIGAAYMFSGFFVGNAQHTGWMISGAWFPFIYYYFIQLKNKPQLPTALKLGFCSFFMFSGGYPGIFISLGYIFLAFSIGLFIKLIIAKDFVLLKKWLKFLSVSGLVFVLLSAVVIVSSLDLSRHVSRGTGLPFDNSHWGVLTGSLPPKALLTFAFPYAGTIKDEHFWGTDFSVINCYFGIIFLLMLIFINFQKGISSKVRLFTIVGILFILIALAEITPFRKWMYMFLPFMNLFRFSAFFRMFAIFFLLLGAGLGLEHLLPNKEIQKKFFRFLLLVLGLFIMLEIFLFFNMERWQFKQLLFQKPSEFNKISGLHEKIFLQCFFQMGLIASVILMLKYWPKYMKGCLVCIICLDMIAATQMNIHATVIQKYPSENVNRAFSSLPTGYPLPSLTLPMSKTTDGAFSGSIPYLWTCMAIYHKVPSCDGNSPYSLYTMGMAMNTGHYQEVNNNPLLFLATRIDKEAMVDTNTIDKKSYEKIHITSFNPNLLQSLVTTDSSQNLILLQNYYPYWRAIVNGKEQPIIKTNDCFMSVKIEKGVNQVTFEFMPVKVYYAFWASFGSLVLCTLAMLITGFWKKPFSKV